MKFVQWHTAPPQLPQYEEYTRIQLVAPYVMAPPELRKRLDEFAGFLTEKGYRPNESFTELTYRYRKQYNGEHPPLFMSHITLFVRTATIAELESARSAGWTWDRIVPYEPGPDCNGIDGRIWTAHSYVDNVQNFKLPVRDPSHNYGITRLNDATQMYACCGKPLSHPGCWKGEQKYELVPYDLAPGFGENVWLYVIRNDWESVRLLWLRTPIKGSMWLHDQEYEAWDMRIRSGKETLTDSIVDALQLERALNGVDLDPLGKMDPLDRATLQSLLDIQKKWNRIQCTTYEYDLFNIEEGKRVFSEFTSLFSDKVNSTYQQEFDEIAFVKAAHDTNAIDDYEEFVKQQQQLDAELSDLPAYPQYEPLREFLKTHPIGNSVLRQYLNRVLTGEIQYDASKVPKFEDTLPLDLRKRLDVSRTVDYNAAIVDYRGFKGLEQSQGFSPYPNDLRNQFLICQKYATQEDWNRLKEVDDKQFKRVKEEKVRLFQASDKEYHAANSKFESWPSKSVFEFPQKLDYWYNTMVQARDNGTFEEFIQSQDEFEKLTAAVQKQYAELKNQLELETDLINLLKIERQKLLQTRQQNQARFENEDERVSSLKAAQDIRKQLEEQVDKLRVTPTDDQIALAVKLAREDGAAEKWINKLENAQTVEELGTLQKAFVPLPPIYLENVERWRNDWPESDENDLFEIAGFYQLVEEDRREEATLIYEDLKNRYEELLEKHLEKTLKIAEALNNQVQERVVYEMVNQFKKKYALLKDAKTIKESSELLRDLTQLTTVITNFGVLKSDQEELIQDIDNQQDANLYSFIKDAAEKIETQEEYVVVSTAFLNLQSLTQELSDRLQSLEAAGHSEEDLKPLRDVRNSPKLTFKDLRLARNKFDKLERKLPKLFPMAPNLKRPKPIIYRTMESFFESIPESGYVELDNLLAKYRERLLGQRIIGDVENVEQYQQCWKLFVEAVLNFPGKRIEWLLKALQEPGSIQVYDEGYTTTFEAIEALLNSNCLLLEPEQFQFEDAQSDIWNFSQYGLLQDKELQMGYIVRAFLEQSLDQKYHSFDNFQRFVNRLRSSNYATRYNRYLRGQAVACNEAFRKALLEIQGKSLQDIDNGNYFSEFTQCLTLLDETWIFIYDFQQQLNEEEGRTVDLVLPKSVSLADLDLMRKAFYKVFEEDSNSIALFPVLYDLSLDIQEIRRDDDRKECLIRLLEYLLKAEGKMTTEQFPDSTEVRKCITRSLYNRMLDSLAAPVELQLAINATRAGTEERNNVIALLNAIGGIKKE